MPSDLTSVGNYSVGGTGATGGAELSGLGAASSSTGDFNIGGGGTNLGGTSAAAATGGTGSALSNFNLGGTGSGAGTSATSATGSPTSSGIGSVGSATDTGNFNIGGAATSAAGGTTTGIPAVDVTKDLGLGSDAFGSTKAASPSTWSTIKGVANDPTSGAAWGAVGDKLTSNPGAVLSALGLGYSALSGSSSSSSEKALKQEAQSLAGQSASLESALNGQLPAGAQAAVNSASKSAKAAIRSEYAQLGMSGGTSEATALANVDQQTAAQAYQIQMDLYKQGVSDASMSSQLFEKLMSAQQQSNSALTSAIGNFAKSLAGG
jgi:hypothetical protein